MRIRSLPTLFVCCLLPTSAIAEDIPVPPGGDWCQAVADAEFGDTILLEPGEHAGPCTITNWGITLRSANILAPADIVYDGADSNVIDIDAGNVRLTRLAFGATKPDVDTIKIHGGDNIIIEECTFFQTGGISVSANTKSTKGIVIRRNLFTDLQATGVYVGCHEGQTECAAEKVVVENNLFQGVTSSGVGYAVQVKLDSYGIVSGNVIEGSQGPGIMIYGSDDLARGSTVNGNFVIGSKNNAAIELGGGPAFVTNNIVIGGPEGGIYSYDYQDRGLVHGIHIVANSVLGQGGQALRLSEWAPGADLKASGNALAQGDSSAPISDGLGELASDNIDCGQTVLSDAACWVDADGHDFWPAEGSPLLQEWSPPKLVALERDYCGKLRLPLPHVGALNRNQAQGPGPLPVDFKAKSGCKDLPPYTEQPPEVEPTVEPPDAVEEGLAPELDEDSGAAAEVAEPVDYDDRGSETGPSDDSGGCGCELRPSTPARDPTPGAIALVLLLALLGYRARGTRSDRGA